VTNVIKPAQIRELRDSLLTGLIERDTPVRLALLAALTGEHLLLIGPPGTAKSEIARRLRHAFHDATYFERLLTRFSTPEELFGPLSIKALEQDRYERKTEHYLPEASIVFLDEIFKANSAILNSLLTLLNEREFDNGKERTKTPLISVVAASNELPDGEDLHALYDRFLLRYQVTPVSEDGFNRLLDLRGTGGFQVPGDSLKLRREDVMKIQSEADKVKLPDEVKSLLVEFRKFLAEQNITVSDRRWRKIVKLLQTSALTNGRQEVLKWDCWLLEHCVWEVPGKQVEVQAWSERRLSASGGSDLPRITKLVVAQEKILHMEREQRTQLRDKNGSLIFEYDEKRVTEEEVKKKGLGPRQKTDENANPLYLGIPNEVEDRTNGGSGYTRDEIYRQKGYGSGIDRYVGSRDNWLIEDPLRPVLVPQSYSSHHVNGRYDEAKRHLNHIESHISGLDSDIASLVSTVDSHLWIQPGFSAVAKRNLEEARAVAEEMRLRMQAVQDGFSQLPILVEESGE